MEKTLNTLQKFSLAVSTGLGAGYCPGAPGTAGAAVGLLVGWLLSFLSPVCSFLTILVLVILGIWTSGITEKALGEKDPPIVVIDEVAGMAVSLWLIDPSWPSFVALFFLFRLFDIWKPFPVKNMEDMFPGGAGIMMDDVMAGLYANLIWRAGSFLF